MMLFSWEAACSWPKASTCRGWWSKLSCQVIPKHSIFQTNSLNKWIYWQLLFVSNILDYQNYDKSFSGFFIQFLAIFQVARQPGKLTLMVRFGREPDQNRWPLPVVHWKPMEKFLKVIQVSSKLAHHTMVWFHENFSDSGKNWKIIKLSKWL